MVMVRGQAGGDGALPKVSAFPLGHPAHLLLLPALVLLVHAPALPAYFAADDFLWVIHKDWSDGWHAAIGSWGLGTAYRPLVRLSFLLDARAFGWDAAPWHAENLALHAANAMLLALLMRQAGASLAASLLAAALFAVAPMDWENVDWISGRTGLACLAFMLGGTLFALRYTQKAGPLWPACLCQALALLCYEPAAVLPLVVAIGTFWPGIPCRRRILVAAGAMAAVTACVWLLRWGLLGRLGLATDVAGHATPHDLAFTLASLGAHAWRDLGGPGFAAVSLLLVAGLWRRLTRRRVLCLLACAMALYLPFLPVRGFTERFAYMATAPVAAALVAAWPRRYPAAWLVVLVAVFAWRSHGAAEGFAHAGGVTRSILAHIAAIPEDGANLVFDGVPTHDGPYYLLWANFEDAVAAVRHGPGFAATSEWVLRTPALLARARGEPTHFLSYAASQGSFVPLSRAAWLQRHGL